MKKEFCYKAIANIAVALFLFKKSSLVIPAKSGIYLIYLTRLGPSFHCDGEVPTPSVTPQSDQVWRQNELESLQK